MIPGSLQLVINKKKYIKNTQTKKMIGNAGVTLQFYPTTNTQKGITIPKEQQKI